MLQEIGAPVYASLNAVPGMQGNLRKSDNRRTSHFRCYQNLVSPPPPPHLISIYIIDIDVWFKVEL